VPRCLGAIVLALPYSIKRILFDFLFLVVNFDKIMWQLLLSLFYKKSKIPNGYCGEIFLKKNRQGISKLKVI
jgi:hypothetical protein